MVALDQFPSEERSSFLVEDQTVVMAVPAAA
jgi:hypothetical protein